METLSIIKDLFQGLGSIGVLVVVFAFWKMGFFDPKKNGNGTSDASHIINLVDGGGAVSASAVITAWTNTTFTLNWDTNITGTKEGIRRILYRVE